MKKFFLSIIVLLSSLLFFDVVKAETQSYTNLYFGYYENACGTKSYKYLYPDNTALLYGVCGQGASPTRVTRFDFSLSSNFVTNTLYHVRFKISLPRNDSEFTFDTSNLQDYLLVTGKNWQTNNIKSYSVSTGYENGGLFFVDAYVMFNAASDLLTIGFRNTDYAENNASHPFMLDYSIDGIEIGPIFADLEYTNDPTADLLNKLNQNQNITNEKLEDINENQQQTNEKLDDLNNNINDSNISDATNEATDFFSSFETDTFGLTSIITSPLNLIESITNTTCSPLLLPLPFIDKDLELPCLRSIYEEYFGAFLTIYQTITFGIVSYWVCVRIFNMVKDFKNPEHDEIEVLDL